jgi:hypothetical protein
MFIGHFAVGLASKRFAPRTNAATLIAAAIFLDILWPIFVLLGWEQVRIDPENTRFTPLEFVSYPWSHSLLMSLLWATSFALIYHAATRYRAGSVAIWIGVNSHWVLDWISHAPDMPLYPGGPRLGLGLWNSIPGTLAVELVMFAVGVELYVRTTRARDRVGRYALPAYIIVLLTAYVSDRFSDPPSSVNQVVWFGIIAECIIIPWAWWFDRHRELRAVVIA